MSSTTRRASGGMPGRIEKRPRTPSNLALNGSTSGQDTQRKKGKGLFTSRKSERGSLKDRGGEGRMTGRLTASRLGGSSTSVVGGTEKTKEEKRGSGMGHSSTSSPSSSANNLPKKENKMHLSSVPSISTRVTARSPRSFGGLSDRRRKGLSLFQSKSSSLGKEDKESSSSDLTRSASNFPGAHSLGSSPSSETSSPSSSPHRRGISLVVKEKDEKKTLLQLYFELYRQKEENLLQAPPSLRSPYQYLPLLHLQDILDHEESKQQKSLQEPSLSPSTSRLKVDLGEEELENDKGKEKEEEKGENEENEDKEKENDKGKEETENKDAKEDPKEDEKEQQKQQQQQQQQQLQDQQPSFGTPPPQRKSTKETEGDLEGMGNYTGGKKGGTFRRRKKKKERKLESDRLKIEYHYSSPPTSSTPTLSNSQSASNVSSLNNPTLSSPNPPTLRKKLPGSVRTTVQTHHSPIPSWDEEELAVGDEDKGRKRVSGLSLGGEERGKFDPMQVPFFSPTITFSSSSTSRMACSPLNKNEESIEVHQMEKFRALLGNNAKKNRKQIVFRLGSYQSWYIHMSEEEVGKKKQEVARKMKEKADLDLKQDLMKSDYPHKRKIGQRKGTAIAPNTQSVKASGFPDPPRSQCTEIERAAGGVKIISNPLVIFKQRLAHLQAQEAAEEKLSGGKETFDEKYLEEQKKERDQLGMMEKQRNQFGMGGSSSSTQVRRAEDGE